jgi:hypothetical protein
VTIKQLKRGKILKDTILWVKTIAEPSFHDSISLVVEDEDKTAVNLFLYNQKESLQLSEL